MTVNWQGGAAVIDDKDGEIKPTLAANTGGRFDTTVDVVLDIARILPTTKPAALARFCACV